MGYWCTDQLIVTVNGPLGRSVVSLSQPFARVGSHPDADVLIPDDSVARRCLYLHATAEGVFCLFLDVASSNPDERGIWLDPDQDVAVGAYRVGASLLTAEDGDALPEEGLATWGSASPPLPVVLVYCGDLLKDKRRFRARLSPVGRRPQCGLQLKGKKVSSFHCVLYWDRAELWCVDLNSSNGTTLNGSPLGCSRVNVGDRLDVGEFGLVFERLPSGSQRAPSATRRGQIPEEPPPRTSRELPGPIPNPETSVAARPIAESANHAPADLPPISATQPTEPAARAAEPPAETAEQRRLREQLAEEVARLQRERETQQARWDLASQQLQQQTAELHEEAARLARERQALESARGEWNDERHSLTRQLTERSEKLSLLEVELTNTASSLAARLAEVERQQVQSEQLQEESAKLSQQRMALERSRQEWQSERQSLTEQLTSRTDQLAHLEVDLAATTAALQLRLAEVQQRSQPADVPPPDNAAGQSEPAPQGTNIAPVAATETPDSTHSSSFPAEIASPSLTLVGPRLELSGPGAPATAGRRRDLDADDSDRLTSLVSQRLAEKHSSPSLHWLWWSAGGIAVVAALAVIVISALWWL